MKIRHGFVSNSSSSSFVIQKHNLSQEQIEKILDFENWGEKLQLEYFDDGFWQVKQDDTTISGDTIMDNFDFAEFLDAIGVDLKNVKWDDGYGFKWNEWDGESLDSLEKTLGDDDED